MGVWHTYDQPIIIGRISTNIKAPASLQTPYLLTIALTVVSCLPAFLFAPKPTFHLLYKLDLSFCSLLRGLNVETGEILPGFQGGRGKLSTTEKVRMKGLVERTRIAVVEVAGNGSSVTETENMVQSQDDPEDDITTDDNEFMDDLEVDGNHGRWEMEIARVYERTIVELGISLDGSGAVGLA